jgi:hypothetical protein
MHRWLWICPILAVLLSVSVLFYWGWSWTGAGVIALVVACVAAMIWMTFHFNKPPVGSVKMDGKKSRGKGS